MHPGSIGPYRVERELGRGAMGEVLLARDPRLDRLVAIKSIPAHLAGDPEYLARFQREAKVLASLNHPGICSIYGVEQSAGAQYLILEFVDGRTLADRIGAGAISPTEAISIARQIAEALEAAHERGVVHRDLKPGNIMLTADGVVKVLDFGLARSDAASGAAASASSESPTLSVAPGSGSRTLPGVVLGSAGYMSPEQARGRVADRRSDIFSFGCVFYEMLTGERAFNGETAAEAMAAVLHVEPDWSKLPAAMSPRVREVLAECLAKDRHRRVRDIGDARLMLERSDASADTTRLGSMASAVAVAPSRRSRAVSILATVAIVATIAMALLAIRPMWSPAVTPTAPRAWLAIPSRSAEYRLATGGAISPDGTRIVFSARPAGGGPPSLWLRRLDDHRAEMLPGTENAGDQFWSWDGRSIAFHADDRLWSMDLSQPGSRRLVAAIASNYGGAWGPNGDMVIACGDDAEFPNRLVRIPAGGGAATPLLALDGAAFERLHAWPMFLPDGRHILFLGVRFDPKEEVRSARLYAADIEGGERSLVGPLSSGAWFVEPGSLVFVDDGAIKTIAFDPQTRRMSGDATTIADGAFYFRPTGGALLSVSRNGAMVFDTPPLDDELAWFDAKGVRGRSIGPKGRLQDPRLSPDGTQVAVALSDRRTLLSDLWLCGADRDSSARLTTDARWESGPVWNRDGREIFFSWDRLASPQIYALRLDDPSHPRVIHAPEGDGNVWTAQDASPDGKHLIVCGGFDRLGRELRVLALDGSAEPTPFASSPADEGGARFSPDGKWVAFNATESGTSRIFITPFPGPGPRVQVVTGGVNPLWSPLGDALYYRERSQAATASTRSSQPWRVMKVSLAKPEDFRSPPAATLVFEVPEQIGDLDISPDGSRFLLRLVATDTPPIQVILNAIPSGSARVNSQ